MLFVDKVQALQDLDLGLESPKFPSEHTDKLSLATKAWLNIGEFPSTGSNHVNNPSQDAPLKKYVRYIFFLALNLKDCIR